MESCRFEETANVDALLGAEERRKKKKKKGKRKKKDVFLTPTRCRY
jgi:hypothetical protein